MARKKAGQYASFSMFHSTISIFRQTEILFELAFGIWSRDPKRVFPRQKMGNVEWNIENDS
jgi:hypothetical protein